MFIGLQKNFTYITAEYIYYIFIPTPPIKLWTEKQTSSQHTFGMSFRIDNSFHPPVSNEFWLSESWTDTDRIFSEVLIFVRLNLFMLLYVFNRYILLKISKSNNYDERFVFWKIFYLKATLNFLHIVRHIFFSIIGIFNIMKISFANKKILGSSRINPGARFLRIFTVAFNRL